jgi:hypothetical protein
MHDFSLYRMGAAQRALLAAAMIAAIWFLVRQVA